MSACLSPIKLSFNSGVANTLNLVFWAALPCTHWMFQEGDGAIRNVERSVHLRACSEETAVDFLLMRIEDFIATLYLGVGTPPTSQLSLGNYTGGRRVSGFFKKLRVQAVGRSDVLKEICLDCSKPIARTRSSYSRRSLPKHELFALCERNSTLTVACQQSVKILGKSSRRLKL